MRVSATKDYLDDDFVNEKLIKGEPLAIRFDEIVDGREPSIKGFLLETAFGTPANTRVTVKQAPGVRGFKNTLRNHIDGSNFIGKLRKGDIIGFDAAYPENGVAMAGAVSTRSHDFLQGKVQVLTAMARPSRAVVNKRGASQIIDITDGNAATVVNTYEAVEVAFAKVKSTAWPGGAPGFFMRNRNGYVGEFFEEKDHGIDYLIEELQINEIIKDEKHLLELIPAWRLPSGREQITKDVDPRRETSKPVSGEFTRKFHDKKGYAGFRECLAVIADEDEWAFGGKTGKQIRVVSSIQPILKREPTLIEVLPTIKQPFGRKSNTVRSLYSETEIHDMEKDRANRRPKPKEAPANSEPSAPSRRIEGFGSPPQASGFRIR